jgi:hypothetical protein
MKLLLPATLPARTRLAVFAAACAAAVLLVPHLAAGAPPAPTPSNPVTANATFFDGLGSPYGGCGLPQSVLDSQDFVALNVYNTPGDYTFYPRPIPASLAEKVGIWDNGRNCGRYVQVAIGDICTGINDGAPNQSFCRNGSWVADAYNGATLTMLVADSCGDSNAWCRDDPYHLDLAKASLNRFVKNGAPVGDMFPNHWNNRRLSWSFVPAPNYSGDIRIGFLQGAQRWWPAISVSHLANGIHGVEYFADGAWRTAQMNGDMGQSYVIGGTTAGGTQFQIRIRDVMDALVGNGRVYHFTLPAACAQQCSAAYTETSYTTGTATPTAVPTTPSTVPTTPSTAPTSSSPPGSRTCTATYTVTNQWSGGFQVDVAVRNTGATALSGWRVAWTFTNGQTIADLWNGVIITGPPNVTVGNTSWNGALAPNAGTTFGFTGTWSGANETPRPTCTAT